MNLSSIVCLNLILKFSINESDDIKLTSDFNAEVKEYESRCKKQVDHIQNFLVQLRKIILYVHR